MDTSSHNKNEPRRPRAMRPNALVSMLLSATGIVLSVGGLQCQPSQRQTPELDGYITDSELGWDSGLLTDWDSYLRE